MTPEEQKEIHKAAIKEAIGEWLDKQFITLGKWTLKGLSAMGLAVLVYLWAAAHGWTIKL
jgi:hypothetical protein